MLLDEWKCSEGSGFQRRDGSTHLQPLYQQRIVHLKVKVNHTVREMQTCEYQVLTGVTVSRRHPSPPPSQTRPREECGSGSAGWHLIRQSAPPPSTT
ncbi:hypothetical protein J6590_039952 [Homalodisca vitripennis]|nr:hypothetical protein J6590_039952 [Homalodisca vitripennis]